MDVESLIVRFLAGDMPGDELAERTHRLAPSYRRPPLTHATLDEHSDWQTRAHRLARIVSECIEAAFNGLATNPELALRNARAAREFGTLIEASDAAWKGAFVLGWCLLRTEQFFDALEPLRFAEEGFRDRGMTIEEVETSVFIAEALHRGKRLREALTKAEAACTRAEALGLRGFQAALRREIGTIRADLGDDDGAIAALMKAVTEAQALTAKERAEQSVDPVTAFLHDYGLAARRFGRYEQSVNAFSKVVELHELSGDLSGRAWALSEIGYSYISAGEGTRGADYLEMAATAAEKVSMPAEAERWRRQARTLRGLKPGEPLEEPSSSATAATVAEAYDYSTRAAELATAGQYDAALIAAGIALGWAELRNDTDLEIAALSIIAKVHHDREDLDEAIKTTRRAIQIADRTDQRSAILMLRTNLANAFLQQRHYEQAQTVLLDGLAHAKELIARTEASEFRQSVMADAMHLYEMYAGLLSQFDHREELLWITEQARARNLTGLIDAETRLEPIADPTAADDLRELRATEVELEVRHLAKDLDSAEIEQLQSRRAAARDRLNETLRRAGAAEIPWQRLDVDRRALEQALDAVVQPGTGVLCLFSISEGVCPVLVGRDGDGLQYTGTFVSWRRSERLEAVNTWNRARVSDVDGEDLDGIETFLSVFREELLNELTELVGAVPLQRLAVVPHGELTLVPYWELLDRCSAIGSFTVAPSVGVLRLCELRRRSARGDTLLLEDPTLTLPSAARESEFVRAVRSRVRTPKSVAEIEQQASACSLVHAATHGVFLSERPWHSGLVASSEPATHIDRFAQFVDAKLQPADGGDALRLLTVAEIMTRLSLSRCQLAVLSACESGIPRLHGGGEMTGLPSAMLIAGARSVVASLWPVYDVATVLLMEAFYEEWDGGRGHETSASRALAAARRRLRAITRMEALERCGPDAEIPDGAFPFDHPLYADAFHCFGAW